MPAEFPVLISAQTQEHLLKWLARKGSPGAFIRIGVKGGGCSGLEYVLKIDTERKSIDLEFSAGELLVVCDERSAKFLQGSELVYTGNLLGGNFTFENPNAKRSCGCGTSFTPVERNS
ncbi:MAG TPA: iron-sulfur cluster assembly accessory protein [Fimbriimonadaceae bacterium]|nr:iron-sulfur cluster assembly accessory protein [Fimbriimonadaceae bacterium]HRJ32578.1 iron-sulfur cluster assembly accessory protein [Fimbriimonadaceae bacterium]